MIKSSAAERRKMRQRRFSCAVTEDPERGCGEPGGPGSQTRRILTPHYLLWSSSSVTSMNRRHLRRPLFFGDLLSGHLRKVPVPP